MTEKLERMEVGERVDSDHQPMTVWIKGRIKRNKIMCWMRGERKNLEIR